MDKVKPPNPGSKEAIKKGCTCPVLDNNHGLMPDGTYWITGGCSLHDNRVKKEN